MSKFVEAFERGASYEEAVRETGAINNAPLRRYWGLLVMEQAIEQANTYFERLLKLREAA